MARTESTLSDSEILLVQALDALATSGASQAIRKSGAATFANVDLTGATNVFSEAPSGAINGANTAFTLANTPTAGTLRLYEGGRRLVVNVDYTLSGANITMLYAPPTGSNLLADYQYS